MSIGDVLAEPGASRGAFYHYLTRSRPSSTRSTGDRRRSHGDREIATDPAVPATRSSSDVHRHRPVQGRANRPLLGILEVWLADENAIVATRSNVEALLVPLPAAIIDRASARAPSRPRRARGGPLVSLMLGMNEFALSLLRLAGEITPRTSSAASMPMPRPSSESSARVPGRWPSPTPRPSASGTADGPFERNP
jgi:hypothetical protein